MRRTNIFVALGLLTFFLLCCVPGGQGQSQLPYTQVQSVSVTWPTLTAGSGSLANFNVTGLQFFNVQWAVSGSVSACTVTVDGAPIAGGAFSTGSIVSSQTCTSSGAFTTSSATHNVLGRLTYSITGTGTVTFTVVGYIQNPATAGGGSAAITSPVDGNGFVEVNCKTGCTGTTLGQAAMAASLPVAIASDQSPVPVTTQPTGFGSIIASQQAVTATAAALPSNAVHGFCVKALGTNTITIYVGPTGVTTSNGYPLAAGDSICYQASNTSVAFVIASTTGASVAFSGN